MTSGTLFFILVDVAQLVCILLLFRQVKGTLNDWKQSINTNYRLLAMCKEMLAEIERLRAQVKEQAVCKEMIAEIERLRAQLKKLGEDEDEDWKKGDGA